MTTSALGDATCGTTTALDELVNEAAVAAESLGRGRPGPALWAPALLTAEYCSWDEEPCPDSLVEPEAGWVGELTDMSTRATQP